MSIRQLKLYKILITGGNNMNCCSSNHPGNCTGFISPQLWSRKKKLKVLEHQLECLEEKKKDILEAVEELKT
jgi:hypothetical protein